MIVVAMNRRSRARFLAPIALAAVLAGTYVVVQDGLTTKHTAATQRHQTSGLKRHYRHARFYVVAPGENLTSIASKTGLPVGALEALNPSVDPNSLQTGQRLRLRR